MPYHEVVPLLLTASPGELCCRPYHNHRRGCPNYGKRATCPPQAKRWNGQYVLYHYFVAVWSFYPFAEHVKRMRTKHPDWTQRQLECCLYWQGTARKALRSEIKTFLSSLSADDRKRASVHEVPEAHGVNVTATMRRLDVMIEWPPCEYVCHVALVVFPHNNTLRSWRSTP